MSQAGFITVAGGGGSTSFVEDVGAAAPAAGVLNILGGIGISTTGAGNTVTINATGFGFDWTDVTTTPQALSVENGYVTDRAGGVTYTLPATASLGDAIIIMGKSGQWTISQNANQQILVGIANSTVGVLGTASSTSASDCMELICITAGAATVWRAVSTMGNITVA